MLSKKRCWHSTEFWKNTLHLTAGEVPIKDKYVLVDMDTNGAEESVLYREVSVFQGLKCMREWYIHLR